MPTDGGGSSEADPTNGACETGGYTHTTTDHWKLVSDSSVAIEGRHSGELVSPKLSGSDGLRRIESMLNAIDSLPRGPRVNETAGHHVHLDATRDMRYSGGT